MIYFAYFTAGSAAFNALIYLRTGRKTNLGAAMLAAVMSGALFHFAGQP